MVVKESTNRLVKKQDAIHIIILLAIALGIGIYLIATTVLIAKDGVFYIEQGQKFSGDSVGVIKAHPFGYPFLILIAHKFVTLFRNSSSMHTWIYSAQSATLLCRLLALIPLYFIGKLLVGSKKSFWAILILVILPYPTRIGCDALRDWPYILFLAGGFFALLWGAKYSKRWAFGLVGLIAGVGHFIRPECAQLVLYGAVWLLWNMVWSKRRISRAKAVLALVVLAAGFLVPVGPYIKTRGRVLPAKLEALINSSRWLQSDQMQERSVYSHKNVYTAVGLPSNITKAIGKLTTKTSENLMYFFVPGLLIGIYSRLRKQSVATDIERFFMPAFIVFNIIMLVLLDCNYEYISRRHSLPLVVLTIFYIPVGLRIIANWLVSTTDKQLSNWGFEKNAKIGNAPRNANAWFMVLLTVGIVLCLPKLLRPIRIKKQAYREVSQWLKENSKENDLVAVLDKRISFYAERKRLYESEDASASDVYVVKILNSKNEELNFDKSARNNAANIKIKDDSRGDTFLTEQKKYVSSKGLAGYWPANSNTKDYSGYNNHGTLQGQASYVPGKYGQAFDLDSATGDFISVGGLGIAQNEPGTIAGWFKFNQMAMDKGDDNVLFSNQVTKFLYQHPANNCLYIPGGYFHVRDLNDTGTWSHIVLTYGSKTNTGKLYLNGTEIPVVVQELADICPLNDFKIGDSSSGTFDGQIDEVMVFNRVLSKEEIEVLYNEGPGTETIATFEAFVNANTILGHQRIKKHSVWVDKRKKKRFVIYKMM